MKIFEFQLNITQLVFRKGPICNKPTLLSGVIEHIELDKGLDMVDRAGVGEKKMNKSEII